MGVGAQALSYSQWPWAGLLGQYQAQCCPRGTRAQARFSQHRAPLPPQAASPDHSGGPGRAERPHLTPPSLPSLPACLRSWLRARRGQAEPSALSALCRPQRRCVWGTQACTAWNPEGRDVPSLKGDPRLLPRVEEQRKTVGRGDGWALPQRSLSPLKL